MGKEQIPKPERLGLGLETFDDRGDSVRGPSIGPGEFRDVALIITLGGDTPLINKCLELFFQ